VLRSARSNAEILALSYPALPPDTFLITSEDIPGQNELSVGKRSMPILAGRRVHYRGEPIVLVCGPDERLLRLFADSIEVRYDELPPLEFRNAGDGQLICEKEVVVGEPARMMSEAFQVVEGEYSTGDQKHFVSDAQGAVVVPEPGGGLHVYAPTQWPFHVVRSVARALAIPEDKVVVTVTAMSAHKDSRIWYPSLVAVHAALLARASRRSVKLVLPKDEAVDVTPRRAPSRIVVKTALDKDGAPTAHDVQVFLDGGSFPLLADELLERGVLAAAGVYRSKHVRVNGAVLSSSQPPMGAFLGLGLAQGFFASETHASRIAELSQADPYTWKRENLISGDDLLPGGGTPAERPTEALLSRLAEISDFKRKHAVYEMLKKRRGTIEERGIPLRGIGLSVAYQGCDFLARNEQIEDSSVVVKLEADGTLEIHTSAVSVDGAARRIWEETAARILAIEPAKIFVVVADTAHSPDSGPSAFSRNVTVTNSLVARACQTIGRKRFRAALPITVKKSYSLPRANRWNPDTNTGMPFVCLSWGAAVVETEVDPVTFEVEVRGIWMTVSCGRVLDAPAARKTVENGIFHSLWWCSSNHGSLRAPRVDTLPSIEIEFIDPASRGPSGGVEELAGNTVPSAYVSAVAQATGRYFDTLPITPELVHHYTEDL